MSSPFIAILMREEDQTRCADVLNALASAMEVGESLKPVFGNNPVELQLRTAEGRSSVAIVKFTNAALSMETSGIVAILMERLKQQNVEDLSYRRVAAALEDTLMEINSKSKFGDALRFPDGTLWRKC